MKNQLVTYLKFKDDISAIAVKMGMDDIEKKTESLVVNSPESQAQANDMIAQVKKLTGKLEDRRVEIYDELYPKEKRDLMKQVNDFVKDLKAKLVRISGLLESKYLKYDRMLREQAAAAEAKRLAELRKAEEEARKAAEEASLFIPEGLEAKPSDVVPANKPSIPAVANMVSSSEGSSYKKTVKDFEIVDFSLIPDEFKVLNEVAVRKEMNKKDRKDVPGIKWVERVTLATRLSK